MVLEDTPHHIHTHTYTDGYHFVISYVWQQIGQLWTVTLLPLVMVIVMTVRIVNSANIHDNVALRQLISITCPKHGAQSY